MLLLLTPTKRNAHLKTNILWFVYGLALYITPLYHIPWNKSWLMTKSTWLRDFLWNGLWSETYTSVKSNQYFLAKMLCKRFFSSVFSFCNIKGYFKWKCKFYRLCTRNLVSGLLQIGQKSGNWQWHHNLATWRYH